MTKRRSADPIEKIVAAALDARGIAYTADGQGETHGLDFRLDGIDVYIECKQFHTPRTAEQMSRVSDVIVIQGRRAAELFADMLKQK